MKLNKELIKEGIEKLGIEVKVELKETEQGVEISSAPGEIEETNGFRIISLVRWKSVITELVFGSYSLPLIQSMQMPSIDKRTLCLSFAKSAIKKDYTLKFEINGVKINVNEIEGWPGDWYSFKLEVRSKLFDTENENNTTDVITFEQQTVLGMMLSLIDVVDNVISPEFEKLPEGAKSLVEVNKYERNAKNRAACINYYGPVCAVCDIDFEKVYGELGKGFIHVHHKVPVSQLGEDYLIDPLNDLIPVCPNCHYMIHRKNIPYTVGELKSLMKKING